jgi:hypothetical protein
MYVILLLTCRDVWIRILLLKLVNKLQKVNYANKSLWHRLKSEKLSQTNHFWKKTFLVTDRQNVLFFSSALYLRMGPGKLTYTFSAERLQISAPRQASAGRASRQGSGKRKTADVKRKMYTLIYPNTLRTWMSQDNNRFFCEIRMKWQVDIL